MSTLPLVSVVVPTRNSATFLSTCLESIACQTYPCIEVVVVDNHSTDATPEIARSFTRAVYTYGPERSAQRNMGTRATHGSYVVFIDSDMVLSSQVVECCVQAISGDPAATGVYIPERSVGAGFWALCKALERSCYVGDDTIEAARFFDRAAFEAVGGYDETLTAAEDWDLSQRIARMGSLRRVDTYISHLEGRLTLREAMQGKFYYGKSIGRYLRKRHASTGKQLPIVRPAFLRHWRRFVAQPKLAVGMVVLRVCEYTAGAAGLIVVSLQRGR